MNVAAQLVLQGTIVVALLMAALWLIHLPLRNAAIVDVGWAGGLALLAALYAVQGPGYGPRKWLLSGLAMIWGVRLAAYLFADRVCAKVEEGRYQQLRRDWKTNVPAKFFLFYQFQGLLCVLLSAPFLLAALNPEPRLQILEKGAAVLWLIAFLGEATADFQLAKFKRDPANKGKICQSGLWRYSRHPNYFFEWLIWLAFSLFALASPWGWLALLCPLLMLYFLFRVTGIPATEAQALRSRGEAYRRYQETTSAFVPWFPRA